MEDVALQQGDEAPRRARLPARARAHLGAALGVARRAAHDRPDVAPAARVCARRRPGAPRREIPLNAPIIVFARAPVPGRVKTRLVPRARRLARRAPARAADAARAAHRARGGLRTGRAACHAPARGIRRSANERFAAAAATTSASACTARLRAPSPRDPDRHRLPGARRRATCAARRARCARDSDVGARAGRGRRLRAHPARARAARDFRGHGLGRTRRSTRRRSKRLAGLSLARAAHALGRRPPRGPRAAQIAPLCFSCSARRSAMTR